MYLLLPIFAQHLPATLHSWFQGFPAHGQMLVKTANKQVHSQEQYMFSLVKELSFSGQRNKWRWSRNSCKFEGLFYLCTQQFGFITSFSTHYHTHDEQIREVSICSFSFALCMLLAQAGVTILSGHCPTYFPNRVKFYYTCHSLFISEYL